MSHSRHVVRSMGSVSFATLLSRILGYARDALVAAAFGGGHLTDAFYAAFRIPNLLRRVLGEGPLTSAFVPAFTEELQKNGPEEARRFFREVMSTLAALLLVLVAAGILAAPALVHLVAWGFKSDPEKFDLTVRLTRITFPFVLFVCLAAVASGALNALRRFFLPALAPSMLSVAEIAFVLGLSRLWRDPMEGLALSAAVGGLLHFGLLVPLLRKERLGLAWRWNPLDPKVLQVGRAILPAVWGLSVDQVNAFVDTVCASFLAEGSVTALYNSNRLMQFPLALFGIAMSTAALPSLSASAAREDWPGMKDTLNSSLRIVLFSILPAMAGLIVLGLPVVELLFEHGRFTHEQTLMTNAALAGYCLGLPAFAAVKVLVSAFYSMKDTKTPVRVATWSVLVNLAGIALLMRPLGVLGLALATSLASTVNAAALFWILRRRLGGLGGRRILKTLLRSAVAVLGLAAAAWLTVRGLPAGLLFRVLAGVAAGAAAYFTLARVLRMEELDALLSALRRSAPVERAPHDAPGR